MDVIADLAACPRPLEGTAVTIGAYDGVHRGHRAVISEVQQRAAARGGLATAVVTFDRHPAAVVRPASAPKILTDLDQKLELLAATGVDYAVVVHFDEARSKEPAEEFVREVLVDCLRAQLVVVGEDFHFGHQRRGNVALLRTMGGEVGFEVVGLELVAVESSDGPVSSTAIRQALAAGEVELANRLLGRPHQVRGRIVAGDRRGRQLGFPTANLAVPPEVQLPADGIYAGWYERPGGERHGAALSLGRRPQFYDDHASSLLEAYLLDFEGDLYGEDAKVSFVARLRAETRFDSVDQLVDQMHRDVEAARRALA